MKIGWVDARNNDLELKKTFKGEMNVAGTMSMQATLHLTFSSGDTNTL